MDKRTVLHVMPGQPFGGIQKLVGLLVREQRKRGLDARVLSIASDANTNDLLGRLRVPFVGTGPAGIGEALRVWGAVRGAEGLLHWHGGVLWANAIGGAVRRVPCLYHAHNYPGYRDSAKLRVLRRIDRGLADWIMAVSESVGAEWRREFAMGRDRVVCVHNGIEVAEAKPGMREARPAPVFGMATRMVEDKGVLEFGRVAEKILVRRPDARFVLAGDGPYYRNPPALLAGLMAAGALRMPGHVQDVDAFWRSCDVAIFTAPKEPFGLRILEAMSQMVPVAGFQTGAGSDEVLSPGTCVCAPEGDYDGLADVCCELAASAPLRRATTERAYEEMQRRFSVETMASSVFDVYARIGN